MKDLDSVAASLSFDDLLSAVNESSRGRWFLDEYQKRLRKAETGDILSAINRIEARIAAFAPAGVPHGEMQVMKAALNTARADIARLAPAQGLTNEGRLFASLAELARKAMAADKTTAEIAPGIVKALQLVDKLDTVLNRPANGDQFFKQDEALFEPTPNPVQKPVLVSSQPEPAKSAAASELPAQQPAPFSATAPVQAPKPAATKADIEAPAQGAKLVIVKAGQNSGPSERPALNTSHEGKEQPEPAPELLEEQVAIVAKPETNPVIVEAKQVLAASEPKIDNPRIVIIRRRPEEMTEVPLADDAKTETAA